jgi:methionyl-tRNA formyltransferase
MTEMRIVFMGSPEFAIPSLRRLAQAHQVVGVVTQPDRPAGRGRRAQPSPVSQIATSLNLPTLKLSRVSDTASTEAILSLEPEIIVVVAFGQILRKPLLEVSPLGCLNLHASLLPRWRGASPVQHAILAGDVETGVTILRMDPGLDTGPILSQRPHRIRPDHTAGTLADELSKIGAELLIETLPRYATGALRPRPQPSEGATLAPRLTKADGVLDPAEPAGRLARRVRAFDPWPGTRLVWPDGSLAVLRAQVIDGHEGVPGTIKDVDQNPALVTAEGYLLLDRVKPPGGRSMTGADYLTGHPTFRDVHIAPSPEAADPL